MATDINKMVISGRLTDNPTVRFTQAGDTVASFSVAYNERKYDRTKNEWTDGDAFFMNVVAFKNLADGAAELVRGSRVIVTGPLKQRSWEAKDGSKRTTIELVADIIAPMLGVGKAAPKRAEQVQEPAW